MSKVAALVVPFEALPIADRQVFPIGAESGYSTFPGEWMPGVPIALKTLGLDKDEASQLIADWDLPHKHTTVEDPGDPFPNTGGTMVSAAELSSDPREPHIPAAPVSPAVVEPAEPAEPAAASEGEEG